MQIKSNLFLSEVVSLQKNKIDMRYFFTLFIFCVTQFGFGQSFYFGPKLGPGLNFQRWSNNDEFPLLSVNGDIFIETAPEDEKNFMYASLGFRTRGSGWRNRSLGNNLSFNSTQFKFHNIVLELGAKRMLNNAMDARPYYFIGLRGEYTVGTNLAQYANNIYFPQNPFVRKFVYGGTFGGGYEFKFREMMKFFVEIGIHPDFGLQYYQPDLFRVPDPFFPGQTLTIRENQIRNLSLELKFGMKFLRKVEYY
jgi:Outer membrane protein beta-barrel domain